LPIEVHTGNARVPLSEDVYRELAQRLAAFGAPDAAERLLGHQAIRHEDKPVVREVIGRWLRSTVDERFGAQLAELYDCLGRDIRRRWKSSRNGRPAAGR